MAAIAVAFASGLVFGLGLAVASMTDPAKVLGFLDLAGAWDPSLAFVLAGAVVVTTIGYALVRRRSRPLAAAAFVLPTRTALEPRLVGGAVLFGVGWGLVGLCPGPALATLALGRWEVVVFVAAMAAGMAAHHVATRGR